MKLSYLKNGYLFNAYVRYLYCLESFHRSREHKLDPVADRTEVVRAKDRIALEVRKEILFKEHLLDLDYTANEYRKVVKECKKYSYIELERIYKVINHPELK